MKWFVRLILFNSVWKAKFFQPYLSRIYYWALSSMNYGGGGDVKISGEKWFLEIFFPQYIKEKNLTPVVFDVGANIGDYSRLVKDSVPNAKVYAFEPCAETFDQLKANLKNDSDINGIKLGFSDKSGTEIIYNYSFEGESANLLASLEKRLPTQHGKIEVASEEEIMLSTIDEFCKKNNINYITLLKFDIEGHELSALKGAKSIIEEERVDLIQFEFGPANLYSKTTFFDFWEMLSPKYNIFRLLPNGMQLMPLYEEQLEIYLTTNYIAVKK